jgi:hypothetical protein
MKKTINLSELRLIIKEEITKLNNNILFEADNKNEKRKQEYLKLIIDENVKEVYNNIYDMFSAIAYVSVSNQNGKENIYIDMDNSRNRLVITQDDIKSGIWKSKVQEFRNKENKKTDFGGHQRNGRFEIW